MRPNGKLTSGKWIFLCFALALVLCLYLLLAGRREFRQHEPQPPRVVVIYNRIPKTGSTTLMNLPYRLHNDNGINVLLVNVTGGPTSYTMTLKDRLSFVRNVTGWMEKQPALYHGHFAYFDVPRPSNVDVFHVNVIRRPIERLISFYYFLRYGDDFRINKVRSRMGNKVTFDECVAKGQPDCDVKKLWLQVPWFCGHFKACWNPPGNKWALEQAKFNLANRYLLVGVTEEMESFIDLLEWILPLFFRGAGDLYRQDGEVNKNHIRRTRHKDIPSQQTLDVLRLTNVWQVENEFYEFALHHFKGIVAEFREATVSGRDADKLHFHFDKIRSPLRLRG